ncbi:hypothetical protein K3495_g2744 [Podosphaera aphanis]|nr:hypothetical protein K3495_g2744 [Podosphaera aphanis]
MDETGARVGCPGEEVVVPKSVSEMYFGSLENRVSITVIETISGAGQKGSAFVIVLGKKIIENWISEQLENDTWITFSDTEHIPNALLMEYLLHFKRISGAGPEKSWRLLLSGHASHHHQLPEKLELQSVSSRRLTGRSKKKDLPVDEAFLDSLGREPDKDPTEEERASWLPNPSLVQLVVEAHAELAKYSGVIDEESEEEVNFSLIFRHPTPVSIPPDSTFGDNDMNLNHLECDSVGEFSVGSCISEDSTTNQADFIAFN